MNNIEKSSQPLSCKLTSQELQQRKATVINNLKQLVVSKEESADGFTYKFATTTETIELVTDFIKSERLCCDFFTFFLKIDTEWIELGLSGPKGAKDFISAELSF